MRLYSSNENYKLYQGNMLDMLQVIEPCSIDSIVTDPPYELNFMGKGWDNSGIAFQKETWQRCFAALKPGGYLLAFGGSRTFHRIAVAIEDAGFEIRDTIMWLYGSGFPKSMDLSKSIEAKLTTGSANTQEFKNLNGEKVQAGGWGINANVEEQGFRPTNYDLDGHMRTTNVEYQTEEGKQWAGWGTALKPAYEPVIVARKPCEGSTTDNVLNYGVGGINIDECRVSFVDEKDYLITANKNQHEDFGTQPMTNNTVYGDYSMVQPKNYQADGRFPANVILTYDETDEQEVCGDMPNTVSNGGNTTMPKMSGGELGVCNYQTIGADRVETDYTAPMDSGSAARYFYCAKASKRDRDEGLDGFDSHKCSMMASNANINADGEFTGMLAGRETTRKNMHPTVKPTDLMQYLVRLVTPDGGTVLDPFNGSGSTGKAVMYENNDRYKNYKYIGIELTEMYLPIAKARIEFAAGDKEPTMPLFIPTFVDDRPKSRAERKMMGPSLF